MIKITITIDETEKEFDMKHAHDIYELLIDYALSMRVEKISNQITFERNCDE